MRKLKAILVVFVFMICITLVSSASIPPQEQDVDALLYQTCINSTYANITSVTLGSDQLIGNMIMTETFNDYYTYNFSNTSNLGTYIATTICDENGVMTIASYDFDITPNGEELSTGKGIIQFGMIFLLSIFLLLSIFGIFKIENYIGRFVFYWISHVLVIIISFISWQMSNDFLTGVSMIAGFFKITFYVSITAMFPMVLLSMAWIFYIHLMNDDIKKMMERGIPEAEAYDRVKSKRGSKR